jgi:hypothetical protein
MWLLWIALDLAAGARTVDAALRPSPRLMRELASGALPLERVIDPALGFYLVGGEENSNHAVHLCGAQLAAQLPSIREGLAGGSARKWEYYDLACDDGGCSFRAAEFEIGETYRFVRRAGRLAFVGIEYLEGGARDYTADRRFLDESRRRFARGCPAPRKRL